MRVLLVNPAYDAALASPEDLLSRYETLTGWADAVRGAGCDVSVAQRYAKASRLERNGVRYRFVDDGGAPHPRPSTLLGRLAAAVTESAPDVVHLNGLYPAAALSLRRALGRRVPLLVQHHGELPPVRARGRLLARLLLRAADGFLFACDGVADPWRAAGILGRRQKVHEVMEASTRLRAVPREEARSRAGLRGSPALLWVGRLDANKDPLTALAGLELVAGRLPGAHLTMAFGEAPLFSEVKSRVAASEPLRGRVTLLGRVPHTRLADLYSAADLFVLCSHHEGSGYALLEALACGLPAVVSDIPTFRLLTDGEALFRPGDPGAFSAAVLATAADPAALAARREATSARYLERFSWEAIGRRAAGIYRAVVDGRAAPALRARRP